ncbi:rieske 2Fe-2S domain protein [Asticcacaulis biprosthecium C19]|uniref:Rieske 2Fe-2S domain protein n=1 Tax=Asticcacaulis biprosthecium C19 TaxID=715226 RepID=F4QHY8_9CAUL|nr:Rieske 2Fe-2S domain-containing protein [Asticcacaulis biprosthecium]EGF91699.1 rieske 2Fe-2S domain protein [Asticcacaulis biprosthecium C19]
MALSREVGAKPHGVKVAGVPVVLWRGREGLKAFLDRCPHRNYPLSEGRVEDGRLVCPYHGWSFTGDGACAGVPGCGSGDLSRLKAEIVAVAQWQGMIFVSLKPQTAFADGLPDMPQGDDYDHFWWAMKPQRARVFDALDNVLDPFHTNFIHDGLIRVSHRRQTVEQTIETFENGFEATYIQNTDYGWMSRALEGRRARSRGRYIPPVAFQGRWEGPERLNLCTTIWFVPQDAHTIRPMARFTTLKSRGPAWLKEAAIRLFLVKVIEQDAQALTKLHDNIAAFGGPKFRAGPGDRLGDKLMRLYSGGKLVPERLGPYAMEL